MEFLDVMCYSYILFYSNWLHLGFDLDVYGPYIESDLSLLFRAIPTISVTSKKLPNGYKSCPKMSTLEKWNILTPFQKYSKNVGNLGKMIVATGFKKLPKVQLIAQSFHTAYFVLGE